MLSIRFEVVRPAEVQLDGSATTESALGCFLSGELVANRGAGSGR